MFFDHPWLYSIGSIVIVIIVAAVFIGVYYGTSTPAKPPPTPAYSCPEGYNLVGSTCVINPCWNSDYYTPNGPNCIPKVDSYPVSVCDQFPVKPAPVDCSKGEKATDGNCYTKFKLGAIVKNLPPGDISRLNSCDYAIKLVTMKQITGAPMNAVIKI